MNVSFYLDIGSLILGGVIGSIITLVVLFGVAVRKTQKAKKSTSASTLADWPRDKNGKFI